MLHEVAHFYTSQFSCKENTAMTPAPRTSPRRKKATGSVVTEDGKRRSTRGKK